MEIRENVSRINRLLRHMYQGTLFERVRDGWRTHIKRRRTDWWQKQIGRRESVCFRLQSGIIMNLYFDSILSQAIYCGNFEWKERQFVSDYLKEGDTFVDVGANIGLFTLIASNKVGEKGKVYSIEPCSKTYSRLVKNVELNGLINVKCLQIAVSDNTGEVTMNVSLDGYDAWNSIATPTAGVAFACETVRASSLDDFVKENDLWGRVVLMKIDVEGWESHVLSGGKEFFSRKDAPVLQVEFTDEASRSAGSSCQSLYRQIEALGYQMCIYDVKSRMLVPDPLRDSYPYLNLFAVKEYNKTNLRLK